MKHAFANATPATVAARHRTWRWFFVVTSGAMLAVVVAGFARTFFLREYFGNALLPRACGLYRYICTFTACF
jgi:hypothetical protein